MFVLKFYIAKKHNIYSTKKLDDDRISSSSFETYYVFFDSDYNSSFAGFFFQFVGLLAVKFENMGCIGR